jgi:hypothetical protein
VSQQHGQHGAEHHQPHGGWHCGARAWHQVLRSMLAHDDAYSAHADVRLVACHVISVVIAASYCIFN